MWIIISPTIFSLSSQNYYNDFKFSICKALKVSRPKQIIYVPCIYWCELYRVSAIGSIGPSILVLLFSMDVVLTLADCFINVSWAIVASINCGCGISIYTQQTKMMTTSDTNLISELISILRWINNKFHPRKKNRPTIRICTSYSTTNITHQAYSNYINCFGLCTPIRHNKFSLISCVFINKCRMYLHMWFIYHRTWSNTVWINLEEGGAGRCSQRQTNAIFGGRNEVSCCVT